MIRPLLFLLLFSVFCVQSWGQAELSYQLGKDSIFIGDQVELQIQLKLDPKVSLTALDLSLWDSIPVLLDVDAIMRGDTNPAPRVAGQDFEWVDYGDWGITTNQKRILAEKLSWKKGPNNTLENTVRFTLWKEGVYALPKFEFSYQQGNQERMLRSQPREALILTVFSPLFSIQQPIDSLQLAEVKPILAEAKTWEDYLLHIVSALVFLLVFAIGYFYLRRKAKQEAFPDPPITVAAHEYALQELKQLAENKLWQRGEVKAYQSELTYILRNYLEHRYDIPALESTTDALLFKLKTENFSAIQKENLREILQVADLVKFAKAQPAVDMNTKVMQSAENFIRDTQVETVMVAIHKDGSITKVQEPTAEEEQVNPLDLPENLAGVSERGLAHLIDFACLLLVSYLIFLNSGLWSPEALVSNSAYIFWSLIVLSINVLYFPLLENRLGGTLGKLFLGLAVRNLENESITLGEAWGRMAYKSKNLVSLLGLLGKGQQDRLLAHDKITATRVVKKAKI
ncbi:MAG: RDD family protein [Saprospiraceae bacterium]